MATKKNRPKGGSRKYGRDRAKGLAYRNRIGKPRGPGVPGNKAGRNSTLNTPKWGEGGTA